MVTGIDRTQLLHLSPKSQHCQENLERKIHQLLHGEIDGLRPREDSNLRHPV